MLYVLIIQILNGEIEGKNIILFLDADKIVFGGVTVEWGVTCKYNEIIALESIWWLKCFIEKQFPNVSWLTSPRWLLL